ncbi:MAG: EAL domain-containing protein [Gammaproteobacteria bacterium]|nr:EAL domain-containing protein [Gammaproteobacteria bacterium]
MYTHFVILDKDGRILYTSEASLAQEPDSILGLSLWDSPWFNHDTEVKKGMKEACLDALLGNTVQGRTSILLRDNPEPVEYRLLPQTGDSGEVSFLIQEVYLPASATNPGTNLPPALHNSELWIENSPICTKIVDLDFNLKYMSQAGIQDLQIDCIDDYYGRPYPLSFYPDAFKNSMHGKMAEARETGQTTTHEAPAYDINGNPVWYHSTLQPLKNRSGDIHSIMIVSINITAQKHAEDTLKKTLSNLEHKTRERGVELYESEERFALAMRGANDGLWDWNLESNEIYYSPRWKSMLGYREDELEGTLETWATLVIPDDKERILHEVQEYLSGNTDTFEVEMQMSHKNGNRVFVLSRAFLVHHESDGKPIRLVGTHVDITERKIAESYNEKNAEILEMIAIGKSASEIYDGIAMMYEARHPGLRCSMLELHDGKLMHGGAPSLPEEYCKAVHGLKNGPSVGSCGTSTYTGKRVLVSDIDTDPKWAKLKHAALPHGLRCCWSEPIKNSSGKVLGAFGMYYNHTALPDEEELKDLKSAARLAGIVMERDQARKRIHKLAYTDELTGLASRAYFYISLEEMITTSQRHDRRFSLLYIDLDNFKDVNDSLGVDMGDLLLKRIAHQLENVDSGIDFIARLGGDEFCILTEDVNDEYSAAHVAQRCLDVVGQPTLLSSGKLTPACSIGIAHFPDDGKDPPSLLKAADTALYAAKEHGKNRYAFYKPELTEIAEYRFLFEQYLREAIEKQELKIVYQPQVNIKSGNIIGVEALTRWHHQKLGQIPPTEFIAAAERIGMIKPLTEWVLRTACSQAVSWKKMGLPALRMAVNISPSHFLDRDLISLVKRSIDETGMTPSELELEVTEGVVQTDHHNLTVFQEMRNLGVMLTIDDFGTGYSSFASIKHLEVDCLKIDKYFVDDITTDKDTTTLVRSMIEMGHNLGHGIVAEGIETIQQLKVLRELGCETAQGYFFSRPVSAENIVVLLGNGNMLLSDTA